MTCAEKASSTRFRPAGPSRCARTGSSITARHAFASSSVIPRGDEQATDLVFDDLGDAPYGRGDDRTGQGHRLEQDHGDTFAQRRKDEEIHEPENVGGVASVSEEHDLVRKSALPGECLKLASEGAVARDDELRSLSMVLDDPGGAQKYVESFDRMETTHRADDEIVPIESELFAEIRQVRRDPNLVDVDGVVDARDLVDPETLDEKLSQGERDREHSINGPAIHDIVEDAVGVHSEGLEARERLRRSVDRSHPMRDTVTD